jgi:uncharacterized repeat protein (TIGR01451 family)
MRILLLSIFSWLFVSLVHSQIVNIPDANFKNALLNHNPVINTNGDGEIQVSEAMAFTGKIDVYNKNITDLTGINAFTNITELYFPVNQVTSLSITGFNSLTNINCSSNFLTSLSLSNIPELRVIDCSQGKLATLQLSNLPKLQAVYCSYNYLTTLNLSGFPLLRQFTVYGNSTLTDLALDNLPSLQYVSCSGCKISNLSLTGLPVLDTLNCDNNKLASLTLSHPAVMKLLSAASNSLTSMPAGLSAVNYLNLSFNKISSFLLDNLNSLVNLSVGNNLSTSFSLANKPLLRYVSCNNNLISNLQLSNVPLLTTFNCNGNQLASLSLNGYSLLEELHCDYNQLNSLTLSNLPRLKLLYCDGNKLATLALSNMPLFSHLNCAGNQMTALSMNSLPNLYSLYCNNNLLTSLPFLTPGSFPALRFLDITGNKVPRLTLENLASLEVLSSSDNPIDSIRLKNLPSLDWLSIEKNKLTSLTLDTLPKLKVLYCGKTDSLRNISLRLPVLSAFFCDSANVVSIDLSQTLAHQVEITNNPLLQYINMRNTDNSQYIPIKFSHNNLLQFICVDDLEKNRVADSVLSQLPGQGVIVSTICSYTPATSSTIRGTVRFDLAANGCSNADSTMMNVKMNNRDGIYSTSAFTNNSGQYIFHTLANADTVSVALQQPSWFNVSPPVQPVNIPNPGITAYVDFCISPNAVHPDVDISIIPIRTARPGFDAKYRIVYSNKGNMLQSGTFIMNFNSSKLGFVLANIPPASQSGGTLNWNYVNLYPFQTRSVEVTFHVSPPPVANAGEFLIFTGTINPLNGDETPGDNHTRLVQAIVNSFDPNDKEVAEGAEIDISQAGEYLHYTIHFQNTGNADAIKVLIKDSLTNNLNWNSFVPIEASHPFAVNMPKGNMVEFLFDNINLPPKSINEAASQGYVSFKIKPKSGITVGERIDNEAKIYFDFNAAIITNTASTTFIRPLTQTDDPLGLSIYPNPVGNDLLFTVKAGIQVTKVNLYNTTGEKVYSQAFQNSTTYKQINISSLPTGILFLEVISNQGKSIQKVIKSR